jgi:pentafunctional AROM polypeptide
MGVEYIDVEISWPEKRILDLSSRKGTSQVIASWHDWSGKMKWNGAQIKEKYNLATRLGDIVKIIGKAESLADNLALFDFVSRATAIGQAKPIIAINMGVEGQMTRILNTIFTPVSHPLLPTKAAPGQLSFVEIQKALHLLGQLPTRRFFLFGSTISQSPSPTLHNTAFEALGLPYCYSLLQTPNVGEEIRATIVSPNFGGASVTIPFKIDVLPLLDRLSPAAEAIGAVNTIIPITTDASGSDRILYGDNTDWLGIRECIRSRMPSHASVTAALIIGAGGTARAALYALHALGAQHIYIFNRTRGKAQQLADAFPDISVDLVDELGKWPNTGPSPNVIVSTLPPSATTIDSNDAQDAVYLPTSLFDPDYNGVVLDAAYKPAETPLLTLASKVATGWTTAQGVELLLEQGYKQFELWTGRKCPQGIVAKKVWEYYTT